MTISRAEALTVERLIEVLKGLPPDLPVYSTADWEWVRDVELIPVDPRNGRSPCVEIQP